MTAPRFASTQDPSPRHALKTAVVQPWLSQSAVLGSALVLALYCLLTLLSGPVRAAESASKIDLPEPWAFLSADSISFAVVRAQADDVGFRSLLDTAWNALKSADSPANKGFLGYILKVVGGDKGNGLITFLPLQMVRVDALDSNTSLPQPTMAVTVAGWPGLQQAFYAFMSRDDNGKAYPTKELDDATLVLREAWEDPTRSHVLTNVEGTFVSFPTIGKAESTVKLLASDKPARPKGEVSELAAGLDITRDTYGVLLNKKGSMLKFLRWLNKVDVTRAETAVGAERMQEVLAKVGYMTWEGDLVSDDEMRFLIRFNTNSPEARKELAEVLKDVRGILDEYGRGGEMQTTGLGNELHVHFTMVGYRDMLTSYISNSF